STAHPPPCPPSLSAALLSALSAAHRRCGTMRALTPAAPRQRDRPLRSISLAFWTCNPQPRCAARTSRALSPPCVRSARCRARLRQTPKEARHYTPPNRVRYLQPAHSPPAASHPVSERRDDSAPRTTQLLSATYAVTTHGTDSHRTDQRN